jgi:urocanate hydratase
VVGSQARIYADAEGRMKIAEALIRLLPKEISEPRTGSSRCIRNGFSPAEKHQIYDGSRFTADMAIQNVIGDSFRGATGFHPQWRRSRWGEVINGGFGMVLMDRKKHQNESNHAFLGCQQRFQEKLAS